MIRLVQEAQQERVQLQSCLEELQQQHSALQRGASALQTDRDHLIQQLRLTEAELEFVTGSNGVDFSCALRCDFACAPRSIRVKYSLDSGEPTDAVINALHHMGCSANTQQRTRGREHRSQGTLQRQTVRALSNLRVAVNGHSRDPADDQDDWTGCAGMLHCSTFVTHGVHSATRCRCWKLGSVQPTSN